MVVLEAVNRAEYLLRAAQTTASEDGPQKALALRMVNETVGEIAQRGNFHWMRRRCLLMTVPDITGTVASPSQGDMTVIITASGMTSGEGVGRRIKIGGEDGVHTITGSSAGTLTIVPSYYGADTTGDIAATVFQDCYSLPSRFKSFVGKPYKLDDAWTLGKQETANYSARIATQTGWPFSYRETEPGTEPFYSGTAGTMGAGTKTVTLSTEDWAEVDSSWIHRTFRVVGEDKEYEIISLEPSAKQLGLGTYYSGANTSGNFEIDPKGARRIQVTLRPTALTPVVMEMFCYPVPVGHIKDEMPWGDNAEMRDCLLQGLRWKVEAYHIERGEVKDPALALEEKRAFLVKVAELNKGAEMMEAEEVLVPDGFRQQRLGDFPIYVTEIA